MTLSNLYFKGCFEEPSDDQKDAVEEAGGIGDVVDKSCSRSDTNSCGKSIKQLFDEYSFYDPQKGLYNSWGNIKFPWEISSLTPNLLISQTNDKWSVASYTTLFSYMTGAMVLVIEDDGYVIALYRANQNISQANKAFDPTKWDKVCYVETTEPAGLPSIAELRLRYNSYELLELFDNTWSSYSKGWGTLQSLDKWSEGRIRRETFYKAGDNVLTEGECGDALCLYIALINLPATDYVWEKYSKKGLTEYMYLSAVNEASGQKTKVWQRVYCVPTGRNKCLEYQRRKEPEIGYDVVEIGSKGHFVEMPVPYRLSPTAPTLTEVVEIRTAPRVLTQAEINALTQPQEE